MIQNAPRRVEMRRVLITWLAFLQTLDQCDILDQLWNWICENSRRERKVRRAVTERGVGWGNISGVLRMLELDGRVSRYRLTGCLPFFKVCDGDALIFLYLISWTFCLRQFLVLRFEKM